MAMVVQVCHEIEPRDKYLSINEVRSNYSLTEQELAEHLHKFQVNS